MSHPLGVNIRLLVRNLCDDAMIYIKKLLLTRVGFWCDGLHDVGIHGAQYFWAPSKALAKNKWFVVIGREYYFESVRDYPIGDLRDVKSVVKNESWRFPYHGLLISGIQRISEQSHRVTSWVVKQEVLDNLSCRPLWIIPEAVCIDNAVSDDIVGLERLGQTVYLRRMPNGVFSSLDKGLAFKELIDNITASSQDDTVVINRLVGSDATEAIIRGLKYSLRATPLRFFRGITTDKLLTYPWRHALQVSLSMCSFYLIVTSIYLSAATSWVNYQLQESKEKVGPPMLMRQQVKKSRDLVLYADQILSESPPLWVTWDVYIDLKKQGVEVRAVNSVASMVTFYLTAPRASDILKWFNDDPRVALAGFSLPVREVNGMDQFAIEVTFEVAPKVLDGSFENKSQQADEEKNAAVTPEAVTLSFDPSKSILDKMLGGIFVMREIRLIE